MIGDNYPDDIRKYDHDPRSPFYDDGGEADWIENRVTELLDLEPEEINIDDTEIADIVINNWAEGNQAVMNALDEYMSNKAEDQAQQDFENMEPDEPDEDSYYQRGREEF